MSEFNPAQIIRSLPWWERAISSVSPTWGNRRLENIILRQLWEYQAARTDRLYGPKTFDYPSGSSRVERDRVVMMTEARDLVENFPPVVTALDKFAAYITPTEYAPATGDGKYDALIDEWFHGDWMKRCDLTGRHTFGKLIEIAVQCRSVDGDVGFALRRLSADGDLKIQLIPAHRIGNSNQVVNWPKYYAGVLVGDYDEPISYRVYEISREGVYGGYEDVPASNFFHYFDPFRVDQYRGITDFHSVAQHARMALDTMKAEMVAVKFASQRAILVHTERGAALARNAFTPTPSTTLPNGQQPKHEYSEAGLIQYLGIADRVATMPDRPSQAFEGFYKQLLMEIALGLRHSPAVLFGMTGLSGPEVRAEFAKSDRTFGRQQRNLANKVLDPIKSAVIFDAIARGIIPPPDPKDDENVARAIVRATRGAWRFPPKPSIDVGYDSKAMLEENRQGVRSLADISADRGKDWAQMLDQCAQEAKRVNELAEKYGITETAIRLMTGQIPFSAASAATMGEKAGEAAVAAQVDSQARETEMAARVGQQRNFERRMAEARAMILEITALENRISWPGGAAEIPADAHTRMRPGEFIANRRKLSARIHEMRAMVGGILDGLRKYEKAGGENGNGKDDHGIRA